MSDGVKEIARKLWERIQATPYPQGAFTVESCNGHIVGLIADALQSERGQVERLRVAASEVSRLSRRVSLAPLDGKGDASDIGSITAIVSALGQLDEALGALSPPQPAAEPDTRRQCGVCREPVSAKLDGTIRKHGYDHGGSKTGLETGAGCPGSGTMEWADDAPQPATEETGPVCGTCKDTHRMPYGDADFGEDRMVMCTSCPSPCEECRGGPYRAFCASTPCDCGCHKPANPKP